MMNVYKKLQNKKLVPILSRKANWEAYFDGEKNKALQIQSQITITDKVIDKMVYEPYRLMDEEILIVGKDF